MDALTTLSEELDVHALFLGQRLELRHLELGRHIAGSPALFEWREHKYVVVFRYGVVVSFGLDEQDIAELSLQLTPYIVEQYADRLMETIRIQGGKPDGITQQQLYLQAYTPERLQLVADVMAKSLVLEYYEKELAQSFDRIDPLALELQRSGRTGHQSRELIKHIGQTLAIQGRMVGRLEISEKPELLWEQPEFEKLFARLEDEFEIRERHLALERKAELISKTAETLLGLLMGQRSMRAEWYIVILIVIAVLLSLYDIFFM